MQHAAPQPEDSHDSVPVTGVCAMPLPNGRIVVTIDALDGKRIELDWKHAAEVCAQILGTCVCARDGILHAEPGMRVVEDFVDDLCAQLGVPRISRLARPHRRPAASDN